MGEAQTAVADDAYASYWNPGGLVQLRHPELAFTHNEHFEGVSQQYVSYAYPLVGGNVLGGSITRLSVKSFDGYDNNGARTGSVGAEDLALGFTGARAFNLPGPAAPVVGLGVGFKHLRQRLADSSASAFAGDAGLLAHGWEGWLGPWARGVRVGLAARHLGSGPRFVSDRTRLPTTLAFGVGLDRKLWGDPLTVAMDISKSNEKKASVSIGAEYWIYRAVAVRAGYLGSQKEGLALRFGLGFRIRSLQIDYSFAGYGDLGNSQRIGLTLRFGPEPSRVPKSAVEHLMTAQDYLRQDRNYEAILELQSAIEVDPGNEDALKLLKSARSKLRESDGERSRQLLDRTRPESQEGGKTDAP